MKVGPEAMCGRRSSERSVDQISKHVLKAVVPVEDALIYWYLPDSVDHQLNDVGEVPKRGNNVKKKKKIKECTYDLPVGSL